MGFCRERLSLSPDKEGPVTESAAAIECAPISKCNHETSKGQHEAQEQDRSRQLGSACPAPNGQENENSEAAGIDLHPPPFVPSLLGDSACLKTAYCPLARGTCPRHPCYAVKFAIVSLDHV